MEFAWWGEEGTRFGKVYYIPFLDGDALLSLHRSLLSFVYVVHIVPFPFPVISVIPWDAP